MRCVELGKVRGVLDETPSGNPATGGRGPDSPLATRHSPLFQRFATRRRGVTLVEMLVTLAILLLMMTVIVQIFQAATSALNAAQVYQELDNQLRLLDLTIRSDLGGVTCKLTPPNNPKNNTGYLEYGENEFANVQGEDSDDYIRFTAKAPAGQPFTGRMWIRDRGRLQSALSASQPITITSEYAEIIYFLRDRQSLLVLAGHEGHPSPWPGRRRPTRPVQWSSICRPRATIGYVLGTHWWLVEVAAWAWAATRVSRATGGGEALATPPPRPPGPAVHRCCPRLPDPAGQRPRPGSACRPSSSA